MDPAIYKMLPEDAWKRIKTKATNRRFLGVLVEVSAWREREAQRKMYPAAESSKTRPSQN